MTGHNFCTSAKDGFFLLLRNFVRFGLVAKLGGVLCSLGVYFITATSVGAAFYASTLDYYAEKEIKPVMPCVLIGVLAYAIGTNFMNVYSMAADSCLHCFMLDEDIQKKTGKRGTTVAPESMQGFINDYCS